MAAEKTGAAGLLKVASGVQSMRRVLVICTRQIGDVLMTTPVIAEAKRLWPSAKIDVLGLADTLGLIEGNPDVFERIEAPTGRNWRATWRLVQRIWRAYDLALICERSDRAHLYGWLASKHRAGLVLEAARGGRWKHWSLRHAVVAVSNDQHVVLERLQLLSPWRANIPATESGVYLTPPVSQALPQAMQGRLADRYIAMQVPSLWTFKQWPLEHFRALAQSLVQRGWQVVLTGSGSQADLAKCAAVAQGDWPVRPDQRVPVLNASGLLTWPQLTGMLKGAQLYIGPDTSVTHLAAACGIPVVAIYGPVDPRLWGPWPYGHAPSQPYAPRGPVQHKGLVSVVQSNRACVPCNRSGCDDHRGSRSTCLAEDIQVKDVLEQALAALLPDRAPALGQPAELATP